MEVDCCRDDRNHPDHRGNPEYLSQLIKDKRQMQHFSNVFVHLERILDDEISRVRNSLFHQSANKEPLQLPDQSGPAVVLSEKLYVPVKEYPDFNFVGRILGPRGMTAKQLEQDTGSKIMVRGKGSMRDKKKEDVNRGKPNWEHLSEELHVLITVEDSMVRATIKLKRAIEEVKRLLVPSPDGEDDLKKLQLMELAIINGTYRDNKHTAAAAAAFVMAQHNAAMLNTSHHVTHVMRSPGPAGAPIILAPRFSFFPATSISGQLGGPPPPLVSPGDAPGLIYQFDPYLTSHSPLVEYSHNNMHEINSLTMTYVR